MTGWTREQMAARLAQDIPDGSTVNLGIGMPELVAQFVPEGREFIYHTENGLLGMGPPPAAGQEDPELINAGNQQSTNPLAVAVEEQIRRLNISRAPGREKLELDLATPIHVIPDTAGNAVVISSSAQNTKALVEVVRLFDRLPATEAVTVQIFPLENMPADRFAAIIEDLFSRGKELASLPGLDITAVPAGSVGPALLEEIA
ncbi:MAG: CoA-transferase, partial [Pirellulaceae bacterium]